MLNKIKKYGSIKPIKEYYCSKLDAYSEYRLHPDKCCVLFDSQLEVYLHKRLKRIVDTKHINLLGQVHWHPTFTLKWRMDLVLEARSVLGERVLAEISAEITASTDLQPLRRIDSLSHLYIDVKGVVFDANTLNKLKNVLKVDKTAFRKLAIVSDDKDYKQNNIYQLATKTTHETTVSTQLKIISVEQFLKIVDTSQKRVLT